MSKKILDSWLKYYFNFVLLALVHFDPSNFKMSIFGYYLLNFGSF